MTNERAALLRAVLADPADDTARLVFADWLQENGEEDRAEFIRWQIAKPDSWEHAEWPRDGGRMPFSEWSDSAAQVFAADLAVPERRRGFGFAWKRGWIATVSVSPRVFLERAPELFAIHPVGYVALAGVDPEPHPHVAPYVDPNDRHEADTVLHIIVGVDQKQDTLFGPRIQMDLWELLEGYTEVDRELDMWPHKTFPSLVDAFNSVSRACVKWGRAKAGLPDWEPPFRLT